MTLRGKNENAVLALQRDRRTPSMEAALPHVKKSPFYWPI